MAERVRYRATYMQTLSIIVVLAVSVNAVAADTLSLNQKLIVACHRLDVRGVVAALRAGADPNAKFGRGDIKVFQDKWDLGWPVAGGDWTPLIALADSSPYPDPPREVKSTTEDWTWAHEQKARIPRGEDRISRPGSADDPAHVAVTQMWPRRSRFQGRHGPVQCNRSPQWGNREGVDRVRRECQHQDRNLHRRAGRHNATACSVVVKGTD